MRWWQIRKRNADLERELQSDLDLEEEEQCERGLPSEEARHAARRAFGNTTLIKEQTREAWGSVPLERFFQDIRFAVRRLWKSPGFTSTAVFTLVLAIGANSVVFSVLNTLLLQPLPFRNSDRIVRIYSIAHNVPIGPSPLDSRDFARENHTFEKIAVFDQWRKNVVTSNAGILPESLHVGLAPLELFQIFGIRPIEGRLFTPEEGQIGRNHVALLTESYWHSHYARRPDVRGETITMNGLAYSIVGIIPDTIPGWLRGINEPIAIWEPFLPTPDIWEEALRSSRDFTTVGLLKPGVTVEQAQADLQTIAANLAAAHPVDLGVGAMVQPLVVSRAGDLRPQLYLLMCAVALILLIACSNLAALLLARNTARKREFAMCAALGASRAILIRQILIETLLVSLIGGGCGVAFASIIDVVLRRTHPQSLALLSGVTLDVRVLAFTFLVAIGASLLFGLAPAVLNTRIQFASALKEGARGSSAPGRHWFRKALVIGQIALSLVLTVCAALFVQTVSHLIHQDMGFRVDHLLKAHFFLPDQQYPTPDAKTRFCDLFTENLRAIPGVSDVSITSIYPPYERWNELFSIEGRPISRLQDVPSTFFGVTDDAYLRTAGIPLIEGRDFSLSDRNNTPVVALINQTFARRFFPGEDPVGRRIILGAPANLPIQDTWLHQSNIPVTVVGIMTDSKNNGPALPVEPQLITLFRQMPVVNFGFKDLVIRSKIDPRMLETSIENQLHALDPKLPLSEVEPMTLYIDDLSSDKRFTSLILAAFAALGLILALIGIYGVVSYLVAQRSQELAIRLALGARRSSVLWLMIRQGIVLAIIGVAMGLAATALASRSLASLLYGVSALDVLTLSTASLLLLAVASLASYFPAHHVTAIDPMQVLRTE
jgi:putative ABC transport system permease protein